MYKNLALSAYPFHPELDGPSVVYMYMTPEIAHAHLEEINVFSQQKEQRQNLTFHEYRDYLTALKATERADNNARSKLEEITLQLDGKDYCLLAHDHLSESDVGSLLVRTDLVSRIVNDTGISWKGYVDWTSSAWGTYRLSIQNLEELSIPDTYRNTAELAPHKGQPPI